MKHQRSKADDISSIIIHKKKKTQIYLKWSTDREEDERQISDTSRGRSIDAYSKTLPTKHGQELKNTLRD